MIEAAQKTESDLRAAITELGELNNSTAERLKGEKAQLQAELDRTMDERDRLSRDLAAVKRETEETWASERVENSLLRERINDVAAEVARLASALEGPNSPIEAPVAARTFAMLSVLGQRDLPSRVTRLDLLKAVGSSPALRASPEGLRPYFSASRSMAVQISLCVSMGGSAWLDRRGISTPSFVPIRRILSSFPLDVQ